MIGTFLDFLKGTTRNLMRSSIIVHAQEQRQRKCMYNGHATRNVEQFIPGKKKMQIYYVWKSP